MTTTTTAAATADDRIQLRRAVIASTIGTTIEWDDFFLYSTVTGLVFAKLFFPKADPLVGTLEAFGVYAVGFLARPIGARSSATTAIASAKVDAGHCDVPVAFVHLRPDRIWCGPYPASSGVRGQRWGGSVRRPWNGPRAIQRRLIASLPQFGVPAQLFWPISLFQRISGSEFSWGWRIPFFLSILLVGIGLYIRLNILETPTFARLLAENKIERTPMLEVIKRQPREILLSAFARMGEQAPFYIFTAFVFTYGTTVLGVKRDLLLTAVLTASVLSFFTIPFSGYLSDRIGRKRMYMIGAAVTGVFGFVYFALLDTLIPGWIFLAILLSLIPHDMMYGPQAALRGVVTGRLMASMGYQLASIIAGGPAPLIAAALFAQYRSGYAIACYILFCAILSLIATSMLKDYTNKDISREYDGT
jgi:MFS family permease